MKRRCTLEQAEGMVVMLMIAFIHSAILRS